MNTELQGLSATAVHRRRISSGSRHAAIRLAGFTFIEVLFAVIILGVGMIMIAAMLPVAIKQNAETRNDLTARAVAEGGFAYLKTLIQTHPEAFPETCGSRTIVRNGKDISIEALNNSTLESFLEDGQDAVGNAFKLDNDDYTIRGNFPKSQAEASEFAIPQRRAGRVVPLSYDVVWPHNVNTGAVINNRTLRTASQGDRDAYPLMWHQAILADRISTADPRFQWTAFYRRDEGSNLVRLYIIAMRMQHTNVVSNYSVGGTIAREGINAPNGPYLVPVEIEDSPVEPDKLMFIDPAPGAIDREAADNGSYLIIAHSPPLNDTADDKNTPGDLNRPYRNNGRIFKLGGRREDLDGDASGARVWELQPGFDLSSAGAGADANTGTLDDLPDGSMNTTTRFDQTARPTAPIGGGASMGPAGLVSKYRIGTTGEKTVDGTIAWAWLVGRGRYDPTAPATDPRFSGPTQDLVVLTVDVPLDE